MTAPSVKFRVSYRVRNHDGYVYSMETFADDGVDAAGLVRASVSKVYGPDAFESLVSIEAVPEEAI